MLSLFAARVGVVQKRIKEKFELEITIKKKLKPLSGRVLYTYICSSVGGTPAKSQRINFTEISFAWILHEHTKHNYYAKKGQ